jgi:hypothetical protein
MIALTLPRTMRGWRRLFWIALRRCVQCHGRLLRDWPQYDDGESLWCMNCGGVRHPRGILIALYEQAMVNQRKKVLVTDKEMAKPRQ